MRCCYQEPVLQIQVPADQSEVEIVTSQPTIRMKITIQFEKSSGRCKINMAMNLGCGVMGSTDAGKHMFEYNNASKMRLYTASKDHLNARKHSKQSSIVFSTRP